MKKAFTLLIILSMIFALCACGSKPKERDLPEGNYAEVGEGTVYISTPGGTSEDGNIPVVYTEKVILMQIGLNAFNFNGSALSFIYVDGVLLDKQQLANTQTSITLGSQEGAEGIHTVEVVQYDNDDPSSKMIAYRSMQYEIKIIE